MEGSTPLIRGYGRFDVGVAETESHVESFSALLGRNRRQSVNIKVRAKLTLANDDYDAPVVYVEINSYQVGELTGEHARGLLRIVRYGERSPYEAYECAAVIRGGLGAKYSVKLDLPFDE